MNRKHKLPISNKRNLEWRRWRKSSPIHNVPTNIRVDENPRGNWESLKVSHHWENFYLPPIKMARNANGRIEEIPIRSIKA